MAKFIYQSTAPICAHPNCNNTTKSVRNGVWRTYCSTSCSARSAEKQKKIRNTNLEKYGVENPKQSAEINQRIINTMIERYGVPYAEQSIELSAKRKATMIEKYGVEHGFQSKIIYNKLINTKIEKYGCANYNNREKAAKTCIDRYGFNVPAKNQDILKSMQETSKERYGVINPSQNVDVHEKQSKKGYTLKEYLMPSGRIIKIRGYENYALDELLKTYSEDDIITETKLIPRIEYILNNKKHYYFPDIYIKKDSYIIEVKSTYTYNSQLEKNLAKKYYTIEAGYKFDFWIYDSKGNKC